MHPNVQIHTTPEAKAVADIMKKSLEPQVIKVTHDGIEAQLILTPDGNGGFCVDNAKDHVDALRAHPERRKGTAHMTDLKSFIGFVQRFKDEHSAIFANRDPSRPSLVAVLDYHKKGHDGQPRFGQHRTAYAFPLSDEWQAWHAKNGARHAMNQADFAAFLEDRIGDVIAPDGAKGAAHDFIARLGGSYASPTTLLELSRGLAIKVNSAVKNAVKLASGEAQITYVEEHQVDGAGPVRIPSAFLVGIPVFKGGDAFQLPVRLRYRVAEGRIVWHYEIWRADRVFDVAFDEAIAEVVEQTELPVFMGAPEG